jgi:hypothetical protein
LLVLNPTPADRLIDVAGVPCFLQVLGMTLETLLQGLKDPKTRTGYALILLMSARPDDIFIYFLTVREVIDLWPEVETCLEGPRWDLWHWLIGEWQFWDADWDTDWDPGVTCEGNVRRWILCTESGLTLTGSQAASAEIFPADSLQERLVSTFCGLYEGFDVQLLADLKVCFDHGGQLTKALMEIPRRINDFSPLLLAWRLQKMDLPSRGLQLDLKANDIQRLDRFKGQLIKRILHICRLSLLSPETC